MGGCAAMNCSNSDKKGFKMYRFPVDLERRKRWTIEVQFPICQCEVKKKIVRHFFTVRAYNCSNLSICAKRKKMFGTASAKKKKTQ